MVNECPSGIAQCPHAQASAELAVKKVFAILGVNVDEPKEVEAFRDNLRFGAKLRRAADKGFLTFVGLVVVGLAAALWSGIVTKITGQ
jgi:hypothetical protein